MFSKVIDSTHCFVPKAEFSEDLQVLRDRFTIRPKYENLSAVPIYRETPQFFGFPRYWKDFRGETQHYVDKRSDGSPIEFSMVYPPRKRQIPVLDLFRKALAMGSTGFLLEAPTGSGKTYMMLTMLSEIAKTALIVVPREHIVDQWVARICEHTTLDKSDIGIVQQNRCDFEGKKIVIGMIHSLAKDKYSEEFKKWPGVLVIDEVHVTGAETFSRVTSMFPARYRIGASATPERPDGMDPVFRLSLGETLLRMGGTTDVLPRVAMAEFHGKVSPSGGKLSYLTDTLSRRGVLISTLAEDFERNVLIASYVHKVSESGRRTLVLSDRKAQLQDLKDILTSRFRVDPLSVGIFIQETPDEARKFILERSKIILATYGMMSMAVDVPDLAGLVFGTPQSHVTQAVGRILRKCDEKKQPIVVDIVDVGFKETLRWAKKRLKTYRELGAEVTILTATPDRAQHCALMHGPERGDSRKVISRVWA